MLNKVTCRSEEVAEFVKESERMVRTYGWEAETVSPWGFAMNVTKVIADIKDFDKCGSYDREMMVDLANGLARVLNEWERQELQPMVSVRVLDSGKVISVREEFANDLVSVGVAELVC